MKTTGVVGKNNGLLRILVIFDLLDNYSCRQYLWGNSQSSRRVALPVCNALVPGPNSNVMVPRNEHSPADMQAIIMQARIFTGKKCATLSILEFHHLRIILCLDDVLCESAAKYLKVCRKFLPQWITLLKGVVVTSKNGPEFARWESFAASGVIDNMGLHRHRHRHSVDRGSNDELVAVGCNGLCVIFVLNVDVGTGKQLLK